ncbi:MAG TPA: hypothetical protein VFO60_00360 [Candidatus Dormibacteraeota bacterium]|nr:hypothetical protein [Candidatus Dormibacteraeota bacterium]
MSVDPLVAAALVAAMLGLGVAAGGARRRFRLAHPAGSALAAAVADRLTWILLAGVAVCAVIAVLAPGGDDASSGVRLAGIGAAVGLLTGVPFVVERRTQRRRLRLAAPPRPALPLPPAPGETVQEKEARALLASDPRAALDRLGELDATAPRLTDLRVRGAAAAMAGDTRLATACALRCLQLDEAAAYDATAIGLLLLSRLRFRAAVRVLERAVDAAPEAEQPRAALVEALRLCGRLRDAVEALDAGGNAGRSSTAPRPGAGSAPRVG